MRQTDRHSALREQLIDAAERTIASRGLMALKARDLAQEAGCAVGTIYNVFDHMDALVLCVGSRTLAMLEAALVAARPTTTGRDSAEEAADDLVRLALAYLEFAGMHTVRWRALFEHRMSEDSSAGGVVCRAAAPTLRAGRAATRHAAPRARPGRAADPGPYRVLGRSRHRGTWARRKARLAAVGGSRRPARRDCARNCDRAGRASGD